VLAGPICTMILGDLGADVIKVERPGRGDDTRGWGPPFDASGKSAYFLSTNRNKLSLAADFSMQADRELVDTLARQADVVVENFLPGALERSGIDRASIMNTTPALVWCTITGFGLTSSRPGYDFVVQAESGWMAITGEPNGAPMKSGIALADLIAGKDAAIGVLAALAARNTSQPKARHIVISLADSARAALINVAQNTLVSGAPPKRWGNAHANLVPYQLFQAKDRPIVIAVGTDTQWHECVLALGLAELASDESVATNAGRLAQRERIVAALSGALSKRPAEEWIQRLEAARVPCGVVKTVPEAISDAVSASTVFGMPSSVGGDFRLPPPGLDAHGQAIRKRGWGAFSDAF